jgi:hypothetical protein
LLILSVRASLLWYEAFPVFFRVLYCPCCAADMPAYLDLVSLERFKKKNQAGWNFYPRLILLILCVCTMQLLLCYFDVAAWYEWRVESKIIVSYIW